MLTSKLAMTVFYEKDDKTINQIRNNETTKDLEEYLTYINQVSLDRFAIIIDYKDHQDRSQYHEFAYHNPRL
jgi:hypothetical protein